MNGPIHPETDPAPPRGSARDAEGPGRSRDVVVVGGGVIGVCCAYFLTKRGARVTVLERGPSVAGGASPGNAGAITPGHVPINKPGRVRQALRSLNRPTAPLFVAPRFDPALWRWMLDFARHCTREHLEASMSVLGPLGHVTARLFRELMAEERLDCCYRAEGRYDVFLTERGLRAARAEAELVRRHGYEAEVLSGAELREREPALGDDVVGGVFDVGASTADPRRFVEELADRAQRRGARVRTGAAARRVVVHNGRATGVELEDGTVVAADHVVLAGGAHTAALTRPLGLRLPLQPAKGYHRDRSLADGATPPLRRACLLGEAGVFCTPLDGFVRFAGTLEFSGFDETIRRPRLEQLTRAASAYFRGVGESTPISEWCGMRPCLPDGLPAIGPVSHVPGLLLATGHAMMGLTLGPVTGQLIAELVLDGAPSLDIRLLRPDRF